jgi:uncharacterized protein (DUF427 family)
MKPQPIPPKPGQESVWDYPRPPRLEDVNTYITILFNDVRIVDTFKAKRVLETSHPPVYYIPKDDILMGVLIAVSGSSFCEWKGEATYYDVEVNGKRAARAAWSYLAPTAGFSSINGYVAFYAHLMDACFVDDEQVEPQPGNFYGGWITKNIVGPFKGIPGSWGW